MEEKFNDLGVDAIVGSDLMYKVGISESDLIIPGNFEKLKDVISFMKELPPDQRSFMMSKVLASKNVDKLSHMWAYVELSKKQMSKQKELDLLKEELSFYE